MNHLLLLDRRATLSACQLHEYHSPIPTYNEVHHVIPRAWQQAWQPPEPLFPGSYDGQHLWDDRTVIICRTGHGNVHYWIVSMTEAWESGMTVDQVVAKVRSAELKQRKAGNRAEFATARLALDRFLEAGGSIDFLVQNRLWGQI